jgi:diketogulonate reductase-like aldo/keto reductase
MEELYRAGKTKMLGASNVSAEQLRAALLEGGR